MSLPPRGWSRWVNRLENALVMGHMTVYSWRGSFRNNELNLLHAEAFRTRLFSDREWDWEKLVGPHSLGWVIAREGERLVGFVNVVWDGFTHAWLQDVMVASTAARQGIAGLMRL